MTMPIVHGPTYSSYVRTVRLALEEKGVGYQLVDVAMLQGAHQEKAFLALNPFGKVPAFEHDGMTIYETAAITRYIDRAFPGPALQPTEPRALARMDQVIGILDSFGYGCVIGKVVWQRVVTPMLGGTPDEAAIAEAMPRVSLTLGELERILGAGPWMAGPALSLADLHLAPVFGYLVTTPEGEALMPRFPALASWWAAMSARPSFAKTAPQLG